MITLGFDLRVQLQVDRIQRSWDAYTRYCREHDIRHRPELRGRARTLFVEEPTVRPPRHRDPRRKAAHSPAGGGYDQHDLSFDHAQYVRDHEAT